MGGGGQGWKTAGQSVSSGSGIQQAAYGGGGGGGPKALYLGELNWVSRSSLCGRVLGADA